MDVLLRPTRVPDVSGPDGPERWLRASKQAVEARHTLERHSGDQAGTTEGKFESEWLGEVLYGRNTAVDGSYILGYGVDPATARSSGNRPATRVLVWHAKYQPDGGQPFWPLEAEPFLVLLAPPGDGVTPDQFVAFRSDGTQGIYVRPGVWHDGALPTSRHGSWLTRQGRVHARVSCDFAREFGCLLEVPLSD